MKSIKAALCILWMYLLITAVFTFMFKGLAKSDGYCLSIKDAMIMSQLFVLIVLSIIGAIWSIVYSICVIDDWYEDWQNNRWRRKIGR